MNIRRCNGRKKRSTEKGWSEKNIEYNRECIAEVSPGKYIIEHFINHNDYEEGVNEIFAVFNIEEDSINDNKKIL